MAPRSLARLALLALLWGSSFLWIKLALDGLSPVQLVLVRLALGAAVLALVVRIRRLRLLRDRTTWLHLTFAALVANAIPYLLFAIGDALACLGAAASYGLSYVYMGRRLAGRGLSPPGPVGSPAHGSHRVACARHAGRRPATGPAHTGRPGCHQHPWGAGNRRSLCPELPAHHRRRPTATSTVTYLLPVVAVVLGIVFLGEPAAAHLLIGTGVVLVGITLVQRRTPAPVS
jgi:uncharacterized membrane protein